MEDDRKDEQTIDLRDGKCRENAGDPEILGDLGYEILSMKEAGIDVEIEENGKTFEENALIKARAVAACCDDLVLADDSGLEVDYLDKAPEFIRPGLWGRILPTISKTLPFWRNWRACRRSSGRPDLSVSLPLCFRTGGN